MIVLLVVGLLATSVLVAMVFGYAAARTDMEIAMRPPARRCRWCQPPHYLTPEDRARAIAGAMPVDDACGIARAQIDQEIEAVIRETA